MAAARLLLLLAQVPLVAAVGLVLSTDRDQGPTTVDVQLLGEAGCPFTRQFIVGTLNRTLSSKGLAEVLRFDFLPFGNAYFVSEACSNVDANGQQVYDRATRACFNNRCGPAAQSRAADCFSGQLVCQHGWPECEVNRYFACARKLAQVQGDERSRQSYLGYMPFVNCVEGVYQRRLREDLHGLVASCAAATGQDFDRLRKCHLGPEGDAAIVEAAKATSVHPGVPWLFVNGVAMEEDHENDLLAVICKALRGSGVEVEDCGYVANFAAGRTTRRKDDSLTA